MSTPLEEIRNRLAPNGKPARVSEHFAMFFVERNPRNARGNGLMGVHSEELVQCYIDSLEATYVDFLNSQWLEPRADPRYGKIPVYVFDTSQLVRQNAPFTYSERISGKDYYTFIGLRSEIGEPSWERVLERARVHATHEVAHAFTHAHRPIWPPEWRNGWAWLDEATAVLAEWRLNRAAAEGRRFALEWVNLPELSLETDAWPGGYRSAWFLHYLQEKHDSNFVRDLWREPVPGESAVQAIERRLAGGPNVFRQADPRIDDVFGAGYCVDTYFTAETCEELYKRFGNRAISHSFSISPGGAASLEEFEKLKPLSSRYYRIECASGVESVTVDVNAADPRHRDVLKASVVEVKNGRRLKQAQRLAYPAEGRRSRATQLTLTYSPSAEADYLLLVVAHVGTTAMRPGDGAAADALFKIQICSHQDSIVQEKS
jgi:hypothetical protein